MNKTHNMIILMFAVVFIVLILSGCSLTSTGNNYYNKKYYQGYDSLDMKFLDASPPTIFYYDPTAGANNEIPITISVHNKGAADVYGVIFITGYDPHIMAMPGGPNLNNLNIGGSGSSWYLNIQNVYIGLKGGGTNINLGFKNPAGNVYGLSAFTNDGQLKGMSIRMDPTRIGYGLAANVFSEINFGGNVGWNAPIALQGNTDTTPGGDTEVYDFPTDIWYLPNSLEQFPQPIMATACFDYATRASTMICVDPRPNSAIAKPCIPQTVSLGSGQGGPVAVTRIEQQSSSTKTVFMIYIHLNKQNTYDTLWDLNSLWKCNPEAQTIARPSDKNIVYLHYAQLNGVPLYCATDGRIRLDDSGNGQISCTATFGPADTSAYSAPFEIELWYGYSKSIYRTLTIKRV